VNSSQKPSTGAASQNGPLRPQALAQVRALLKQGQLDQARMLLRQAKQVGGHDADLDDLDFLLQPGWKLPISCPALKLRLPTLGDALFFKQCFADAAFMHDFHRTARRYSDVSEIEGILSRQVKAEVHQSASVHWVMACSAGPNERPIGLASLANVHAAHRRAEFLIGVPQGKAGLRSLALTGALLAMDFAFNRVGLNKLTTIVFADNPHSQKSTLSLGFEQEGFRRQHMCDRSSGQWLDCFDNGMTVQAFRGNQRLSTLSLRLLGRDITLNPMQAAA